MMTNEAIVLAGGLGTRLQRVLPDIPKCMAPIHGKPFLTYVLDYLVNQQIDKVILSVGYRKEHIINYFSDSYKSLSIEYAIEPKPLGTGGAIKFAFGYCKNYQAFVINGDTFFTPDLSGMEKHHVQSNADATIAVKYMQQTVRYGLVVADPDGRITNFAEKESDSGGGWINGGLYLLNRQIFNDILKDKFSIEIDIYKANCEKYNLHAFRSDSFFLDMGIPEDYMRAQTMIASTGEVL